MGGKNPSRKKKKGKGKGEEGKKFLYKDLAAKIP
jgi:hypothetical protein